MAGVGAIQGSNGMSEEPRQFTDSEGTWYRSTVHFNLFDVIAGQAKGQMKVKDGKIYIHHNYYVGYLLNPLKK